ncbi:MAG TPA: Gfo/Idh/MocA family oxidoreductase [Candidatus Binatia bacterium]|nr:Gfo/Idh/MocA family oxidoreductase [Candidatus Binatia bacterium]
MTPHTVRWGVLSTADINASLIPGLLAADGCALEGIASRSRDRAEAAAARWGCRPYDSYEALLGDPSIDAVYIPLPNHLHAEWTIKALEAGKHVLCEKPVALSVTEVDRIAAAAQRAGRLVLEAFMYRHAPRWRRAVALVASGAIGEPRIVRVGFAFFVATDLANIRFRPEAGGGIVWDMGCYAANMARGMLRQEPAEVFAFAESREGVPVETTVSGVMRFPGKVAAPFWISFDFGNPFAQVEVVGSHGWIALPGTGFRHEPLTKLLLHEGGAEVYAEGVEPTVESFTFVDPYRLEVEHLSDAIRGRSGLDYGLAEARANTAALQAMHRSIAGRRPEPVT